MKYDFSEQDQAFRVEVRAWLEEVVPKAARPSGGAAAREYDLAWQRTQHAGGWAGISWPREYGGRGLTLGQQMIWHEESARAGAPAVGCLQIALNHAGPTLLALGNEAQKAFHLPRILAGEVVWCQGFSEPDAGSDLAAIRTRGVVEDDALVVTGQKIWTSFAHQADFQELLVRTDPQSTRHAGLTWVICDMRTPGIEIRPIETLAGDQQFNAVFYDQVRIPLSNVVGEIGQGWKVAMSTLAFERGTTSLGHSMHLSAVVDKLMDLARTSPGPRGEESALDNAEVADRLAGLRADAVALRSMNYATISRAARSHTPGPEGAIVYLFYGELIRRVRAAALDLLEDQALVRDGEAGEWVRGYLEELKYTIGGGTSEIRRNIIAERVLGLPRSY